MIKKTNLSNTIWWLLLYSKMNSHVDWEHTSFCDAAALCKGVNKFWSLALTSAPVKNEYKSATIT